MVISKQDAWQHGALCFGFCSGERLGTRFRGLQRLLHGTMTVPALATSGYCQNMKGGDFLQIGLRDADGRANGLPPGLLEEQSRPSGTHARTRRLSQHPPPGLGPGTAPAAKSIRIPSTRYSTPWALNSGNRSLKSWLTGFSGIPWDAGQSQLPHVSDPLLGCRVVRGPRCPGRVPSPENAADRPRADLGWIAHSSILLPVQPGPQRNSRRSRTP